MSQNPKRVKDTVFFCSVSLSVCRVRKFDESDYGKFIFVICRKVLVINSPSTPIKITDLRSCFLEGL